MESTASIPAETAEIWYHSPEVWVTVAFVMFIGVALQWVIPPIVKGLDARGQKIRDQLEQASRLRAEAEALLATYQTQQAATLKEAEEILAAARKDADMLRAQAAQDLVQSLARRTAQAEEKIARAEADAVAQLRRRMIEAATVSAREALQAQVPSEAHDPALRQALETIEAQLGAPASGATAAPRRAKRA